MKLSRYSGYYLMVTGVIHNIVGFYKVRDVLYHMHQMGWWNSASFPPYDRFAAMWFLICGFSWMAMGFVMHQHYKKIQRPPALILGIFFTMMGIIGVIILPVSGMWLFIPQGIIIIWDNYHWGNYHWGNYHADD